MGTKKEKITIMRKKSDNQRWLFHIKNKGDIIAAIKQKISKTNRTQSAIANDCGIKRSNLNVFLKGKNKISVSKLSQLLKVLKINLLV